MHQYSGVKKGYRPARTSVSTAAAHASGRPPSVFLASPPSKACAMRSPASSGQRDRPSGLLCGRLLLALVESVLRPGGWENMCRLMCHCVRHIGLDNKHGRSVEAIHSFLSRWTFPFEKVHPHRMEASHANLTALRATRTPTHANTRAAGALHDPLHAHRVKTARTSPRARKHAQRHFRAVPCASALCWHPMAVPSRPHQPRASRTTRARRTTTHAATRAPQCTSH